MLQSTTVKNHLGVLSVVARETSSLIKKIPKDCEETLSPSATLLASLILLTFLLIYLVLN